MNRSLVTDARGYFSQHGEDELIAKIFEITGTGNRFCCEFGAWDGIHLSNTRALILDGWSALLIEPDPERFEQLRANAVNRSVVCINANVDADQSSLSRILENAKLSKLRLDLLSIDIDGMDYDVFCTLYQLRALPRLVVVEVHPEHGPERVELVPGAIARHNIGQPLAAFVAKGDQLGYRLICYFGGNAFFLANDVGMQNELPTISASEGWDLWYAGITKSDADYLWRRNIGLNGGVYNFNNPKLTAKALGIPYWRAKRIFLKYLELRVSLLVKSALRSRKVGR